MIQGFEYFMEKTLLRNFQCLGGRRIYENRHLVVFSCLVVSTVLYFVYSYMVYIALICLKPLLKSVYIPCEFGLWGGRDQRQEIEYNIWNGSEKKEKKRGRRKALSVDKSSINRI